MTAAKALMETCFLSYKNTETGLGADEIAFLATEHQRGKEFEMPEPNGFYVIDPEYALRPVESLFVLYRITGDPKYQEYAWTIAEAIEKHCKTQFGYSALANVMDSTEGLTDYMPSHFLAETLKYLYLVFSPPDQGSLDEYLFTTQGHLIQYSRATIKEEM
ncbi:Mannosyl-oligosaccharide 1,2-alpha-mannosidase IB [Podila humilis]|nr:Mannosyl-oligosaccharide 1,2-alpha-mannosidase IB [Podila humilis]